MRSAIVDRAAAFAATRARRQLARLPSSRSFAAHGEEARIAAWLARLGEVERVCVDIAASDGSDQSNTLGLFRAGWSGVCVEADPARFKALAALHARTTTTVGLTRAFVTPQNVQSLLLAHEVPHEPGFLSFDIDGYDHWVLAALLERFRPALMCVEINEKIPPPLRFTVCYSPTYRYRGDHFFGQSISQLAELASVHDYALVELHYNNAFLVPAERGVGVALSPEEAYAEGYANRPDRRARFPYNEDVEALQSLPAGEAAAWLRRYFAEREGEYELEL